VPECPIRSFLVGFLGCGGHGAGDVVEVSRPLLCRLLSSFAASLLHKYTEAERIVVISNKTTTAASPKLTALQEETKATNQHLKTHPPKPGPEEVPRGWVRWWDGCPAAIQSVRRGSLTYERTEV
jgi:hypothetical protein